MRKSGLIGLIVCVIAASSDAAAPSDVSEFLPKKPAGLGRPATDRAAWKALTASPGYRSVVDQAAGLIGKPLPVQSDELYLDFSRTGNRSRWQRVASARRSRIGLFTVAECLENHGRFITDLEKVITAVCSERTWVYPAHDRSLANFKGKIIDIDLASSYVGWELATAKYLLGDKLSAKTRKLIDANLRKRIFDPYMAMVSGKRRANWWLSTTNNWNAVCLAGVTGAALANIESRAERAKYVAAAMKYSKSFLAGFTSDGYCSEGLGYWSYGFGNYVQLAETIWQATGGRIDMMEADNVRAPAMFPQKIEIMGGVSPAFADCSVNARASRDMVHFLSRRYSLGADPDDDKDLAGFKGRLPESMIFSFSSSISAIHRGHASAGPGVRTWFDKAGVLICRPKAKSKCLIGVALKGGHNAEHHNHNDVGSYVVVAGKTPVLVDPGAEVYTSRTFSSKRYVSGVLNSLGHPVPRIAGKLQQTGRGAKGTVVKTNFTDDADTLVLDIRSAYVKQSPHLTKLNRTFTYSRLGTGSLTVVDDVAFSKAASFETALITLGKWERSGNDAVIVSDGGRKLRVEINTGGAEYGVKSEQIKEDVKTKTLPTRIGIALKAPVTKATVTLKITPVEK
ncbi:MAG: heparinase II/III family protein [Phycisphaerae bacterium]|jgi:hypothetical protein|nr:heparinase II/III family protein [Phycisphaerae bacterium]